jgi:dihydrofolate reductase
VALLQELKEQGKQIWIVGGGATNARFHEADLIDELILTYIPTMLGNGIPLFRENEGKSEWKTEGVRSYSNGLVQLHLVRS